jgi:hypothetical protein
MLFVLPAARGVAVSPEGGITNGLLPRRGLDCHMPLYLQLAV